MSKYADFANIFFSDLAAKLPKHTGINSHPINLVEDQRLPYKQIYSLGQEELETLKEYITINLVNNIQKPSTFLTKASISFMQKSN